MAGMICKCSLKDTPSFEICGRRFISISEGETETINACANIGADRCACEHGKECHETDFAFMPALEMGEHDGIIDQLAEALDLLVKALPIKRDWLDPDIERFAKMALAKHKRGAK